MTDKQIIDGVDVIDCDWFYSGDCACDILDYSMCIDNSACYFKQLKRLQSELEAKKEQEDNYLILLKGFQKKIEKLEKENDRLKQQEPDSQFQTSLSKDDWNLLQQKLKKPEFNEKLAKLLRKGEN